MSYDTQRPHIASYIIARKGNKVAFVLRSNTDWMNNHYGLPAGKVELGESFEQAAIREAKEEIGITVKPKDIKHVLTVHRFEDGDHAPEWVDVFFEVQRWTGEVVNSEPHVHSEVAWLDLGALPDNTIPSLAVILNEYAKGKNYIEYGWEEAV